jgi:hypothetical protein
MLTLTFLALAEAEGERLELLVKGDVALLQEGEPVENLQMLTSRQRTRVPILPAEHLALAHLALGDLPARAWEARARPPVPQEALVRAVLEVKF